MPASWQVRWFIAYLQRRLLALLIRL